MNRKEKDMVSGKEQSDYPKPDNGGAATATAAPGDFDAQLKSLRDDLSKLAATVASRGAEQASDYKAKVKDMASNAFSTSQEAIKNLGDEMKVLEQRVERHVRERPVRSLGIAAAAGFLLAIACTRR